MKTATNGRKSLIHVFSSEAMSVEDDVAYIALTCCRENW